MGHRAWPLSVAHLILTTARPGVCDHPQSVEEEAVTQTVQTALAKSSSSQLAELDSNPHLFPARSLHGVITY